MAGSYYIALSGMRARLDALDRVAADIANVNTAGYKAERATTAQADRPAFGDSLQSAIDVADGPTRLDLRSGSIAPTSRDLDVAIDGPGLFAVATAAGERYTRDGRFTRRPDGMLATAAGEAVVNQDGGSISLPQGPVQVDADGSVRSNGAVIGRLKVVQFQNMNGLTRETANLLRADGQTPIAADQSQVRAGALEQSNVSLVDRVTELTTVSRGFETLQRALSTLANDVDARAISELGRR